MALEPKDPRVKRLGDEILNYVRDWLDRECRNDPNLRFLVNKWVFSRLQLDSRQETERVKKSLMEHGITECQGDGPHQGNLQVHRLDESMRYTEENCILLCEACHKREGKRRYHDKRE
jgi:hypothetical protein